MIFVQWQGRLSVSSQAGLFSIKISMFLDSPNGWAPLELWYGQSASLLPVCSGSVYSSRIPREKHCKASAQHYDKYIIRALKTQWSSDKLSPNLPNNEGVWTRQFREKKKGFLFINPKWQTERFFGWDVWHIPRGAAQPPWRIRVASQTASERLYGFVWQSQTQRDCPLQRGIFGKALEVGVHR